MPMGPAPLGFVYYVAAKFIGYNAAGYLLNKKLGCSLHFLVFGTARTILGVIAGTAYAACAARYGLDSHFSMFYILLLPIRFAEWFFLIWLFYHRQEISAKQLILYSVLGTIWSYFLDLPAIASVLLLPGGVWVC